MGMSIEELVAENDRLNRQLAYESTALTMMKADYEARLKADMVAMLEVLDLQIDELTDCNFDNNFEVAQVQRLIRDKINSLKEAKDVSS